MTEQQAQLDRVEGNIAHVVGEFLANVGGVGTFRAADLQQYVCSRVACSPASPDRILRALKRAGVIDYTVLSRARSLYRFDGFCERVVQRELF